MRVISRVMIGKLVVCSSFCCLTPVKRLVTDQSLSNSDSSEEEKRVGYLDLNEILTDSAKEKEPFHGPGSDWKQEILIQPKQPKPQNQ